MTQKKLILFMPSIEGGGVEKNFFIISNFLEKKFKKTFLITTNKEVSHKLHNIEFVCPKSMFFQKGGRIRKYFICSFLLVKMLIKENNKFVFSFQANLFAILISKIFNTKILSRSNSSPSGWSRNIIKDMIYKIGFKLANTLIVNSTEFKNEIRKKFSVKSVELEIRIIYFDLSICDREGVRGHSARGNRVASCRRACSKTSSPAF